MLLQCCVWVWSFLEIHLFIRLYQLCNIFQVRFTIRHWRHRHITGVVNLRLFLTIWLVGCWWTLRWWRWNRTCFYSSINMCWRHSLMLLDLFKFWRLTRHWCKRHIVNQASGGAGLAAKAQENWVPHQEDEEEQVSHYGVQWLQGGGNQAHCGSGHKNHSAFHNYFGTGPLQCLRDVPQRIMFLTIIYGWLHAIMDISALVFQCFGLLWGLPQDWTHRTWGRLHSRPKCRKSSALRSIYTCNLP